MSRFNIEWTKEREAVLKAKWAEGCSASEVAKQMGEGITRSAVIGKVHRLGLSGRARAATQKEIQEQRRVYLQSESQRDRERRAHPVPRVQGTSGDVPLPDPTLVEIEPVFPKVCGLPAALLQRAEGQCHFPINEPHAPDFHYCTSGRAKPGAEYCATHQKVMESMGAPSRSHEWYEQRRDWAMKNPTSPLGRRVIAYFAKRDAA